MVKFYNKYRHNLRSKTKDTSEYGYLYLSGLLRMETNRTISQIAQQVNVSAQNMQHFVSNSPWSGYSLIEQLQQEIGNHQQFQTGSVLLLAESANEKSGQASAGAGRQHNGRLGKVEMSQVGVFLSLSNNGYHTWIDGELYLPKHWFSKASASRRKRIGRPESRRFQTKLELGLMMVKRVQQKGVPFEAVDCDSLYGRKGWLRDELKQANIEYYADAPHNTQVYLEAPLVRWKVGEKGQPTKELEVIGQSYHLKMLKTDPGTMWQTITLRPHERGMLKADFARRWVWTVRDDGTLRQEWLLIRQSPGRTTYSFSNAAKNTSLFTMAHRKSQRYFIERSNQEAKSDFGWDEFQAIKYRAWEQQLALTIMASWFITETRLDWAQNHPPDPHLLVLYQTDVLPNLSVANVRTLLRAAMPLPQLSLSEATDLVIKHLDNRTRSRKSRLHKARSP